jgi:hypothetical protein
MIWAFILLVLSLARQLSCALVESEYFGIEVKCDEINGPAAIVLGRIGLDFREDVFAAMDSLLAKVPSILCTIKSEALSLTLPMPGLVIEKQKHEGSRLVRYKVGKEVNALSDSLRLKADKVVGHPQKYEAFNPFLMTTKQDIRPNVNIILKVVRIRILDLDVSVCNEFISNPVSSTHSYSVDSASGCERMSFQDRMPSSETRERVESLSTVSLNGDHTEQAKQIENSEESKESKQHNPVGQTNQSSTEAQTEESNSTRKSCCKCCVVS